LREELSVFGGALDYTKVKLQQVKNGKGEEGEPKRERVDEGRNTSD
jgi:hypothetical protein